jgi:ATP-dependent DNA helicase RecG
MENDTIEYKVEFTKDIKKEVVAFLNTTGGTIYIGYDDNGELIGLDDVDNVALQSSSSFINSITPDPTAFIKIKPMSKNGKGFVRVEIESGTFKPYYISDKGLKPSGVYTRIGSSSIPASESLIRALIKLTDGDKFIEGLSLNQNLTFKVTDEHFKNAGLSFGDNEKKTLGLIRTDNRFSNLALLLSDQCEHTIKVAIFEGTSKSVFKDRKEFKGSILSQLDSVVEYLNVYNKISATFDTFNGISRKDIFEYPPVAIREALLNAIAHREYSLSGSILVNLYDDKLEIVSLGGLVYGLTKEDIINGISQTRNEKLANILYRLKYIEAYGTGIPRIIDLYKNSEKKPDFKVLDGSISVILPNIKYNIALKEDPIKETVNKNETLIIEYLNKNTYLDKETAAKIINKTPNLAYRLLTTLCEKNIVKKEKESKKFIYKLK